VRNNVVDFQLSRITVFTMTTQFPSPGKSALLRHRYQAEATVLSAHFELPIARDINKQAHVALPEDGTYTYQAAEAFKLVGLLSFGSGYAQVAGHAGVKREGFTTHASSVLERVNVLDVVTADRVIGQISTVHFADDGNVPSVSFLGTRFENLRINGNPVEIEQDLRILGEKPAGNTSYFEDVGVRTRVARQYEGIRKSPYLPEWAVNEFLSRDHEGGMGKIKCSLVQSVHGAPWRSFGHVVEVPDFGRIFLGELTVVLKNNDYTFDLSMIRMELDSIAVGTTRLVNVVCGGGTNFEVKPSLQESIRPSMQQFVNNFRRAFMPAMPSHVDPYLLHAFRNSARTSAEEVVYGAADSDSEAIVAMSVPMVLRVGSASWNSHDVTGFVETSRLGSIVCGRGSAECLTALAQDPNVLGIEGSRAAGMRDCHVSVGFVHADVVHQPPIGETGNNALIGIIDEGIDVLHEAFLDASGRTRILALWDQTGTGGARPAAGYGTLHTEMDINSYISTGKLPHSLQRDPSGHGTHVASIAAGRAVGSFAGGIAPDARIIAVITTLGAPAHGAPFSLGYSNSHIDALKFIQDFAHSRKMPVVVNVSLGMNAGAHDGTSALETAFDEFSKGGREPGYVIVKSAGNEHGMDGHARLKIPKHSKDDLSWSSKAVKRDEDVIELWFKPSDELRFRLKERNRHG
jgi:Subtilase family